MKQISLVQKFAWFYAAVFLFVVVISHFPGLTDAQGKLLGLYRIDPIDDIFHLVSGLAAVVVALNSQKWSTIYFKIVGIPYGIDALTGLLFSTQFLNGDFFTMPLGAADFSIRSIGNNMPHVLLAAFAIWVGYFMKQKIVKKSKR